MNQRPKNTKSPPPPANSDATSSAATGAPSYTVTITDVAYGGKGVARIPVTSTETDRVSSTPQSLAPTDDTDPEKVKKDGMVVFVADGIPGDIAEITLNEANGRYGEGTITRLVTPSPLRAATRCPHFTKCGGCQWQHIEYDQQLDWKKSFITSALRRIGKLPATGDVTMTAATGPSRDNAYRNRVFLRGRVHTDGHIELGYFAGGSHTFVAIDQCAIADPHINTLMAFATSQAVSPPPVRELKFRLELQRVAPSAAESSADLLGTIFPEQESDTTALLPLLTHLRGSERFVWINFIRNQNDAPFVPFENEHGLTYHTAAGQFQQVNLPMNQLVRRKIHGIIAKLTPAPKRILDVFCGSGNLSLELTRNDSVPGRYVEGIENSARAISCAKHNLEANSSQLISPSAPNRPIYISGDATKHLYKCSKKGETFDLVITDPPRQGMYEAVIPLLQILPRHIIYLSCDPTTLARDLGKLCKTHYRLVSVDGFDFFPNTYHVETLAVLERI